MPRKKKHHRLWSISRITDPRYPTYTVRITELERGGKLYAVRMVGGKQKMACLHRCRADLGPTAKAQEQKARALALDFIEALATAPAQPAATPASAGAPLTLGALVAAYEKQGFPGVGAAYRRDQVSRVRRLVAFLGSDRPVASVSRTDVQRWAAERRGKVRQDTVRGDLNALSICCNWGVDFWPNGHPLLDANPLATVRLSKLLPKDPDPRRPVATPERYQKLRAVALLLPPVFGVLLDLAWATGRRKSAILGLRWRDVDFATSKDAPHGTVRWYAGSPTTTKRRDQKVPMNTLACEALHRWREQCSAIGDAWVFLDPNHPEKPLAGYVLRCWLRRAEQIAELEHLEFGGWHQFRRGWATLRKDLPLKDVMEAGGWRDEATLVRSYLHADPATTLRVIEHCA